MKQRTLNTLFTICFTWFVAFSTPSLHAFLASAKAAGMGLTGAAYPQDALAAAFNPAGATFVCDRADLGFSWDHYEGRALVSGSPVAGVNGSFNATHAKNFFSPDLGINKTFCLCEDWDLAVGVVAYNRDFLKTTYGHAFPLLGRTKLKLELIREEVSPYIAVKFCDQHSLGISVNVVGQRLKVNGVENFDNTTFSSNPGHVTDKGYDYSYGVGVTFGWTSKICDWLTVGAAYTPRIRMGDSKSYSGFLAGKHLDVPGNFVGGIAVSLFPCSTFTFDVQNLAWDKVRPLHNPLTSTNLTTTKLGDRDGIGFGWRNQTIYRFGLDYQFDDCLTVRAGYRFGKTPIRSSQTAVNLLTAETVEQYVTVGATWTFCDCAELTAYYAHGFKNTVHGPNAIPTELGGGNANLNEHRDVAGLSIGYCY